MSHPNEDPVGDGPDFLDHPILPSRKTWSDWGLKREQGARLFAAAAAFHRAKPWKHDFAGRGLLATVPGKAPWTFHLVAKPGGNPSLTMWSTANDDSVSIGFTPIDDIASRVRREIERADWEVASVAAFPSLRFPYGSNVACRRECAEDVIALLGALTRLAATYERPFGTESGDNSLNMATVLPWTDSASGVAIADTPPWRFTDDGKRLFKAPPKATRDARTADEIDEEEPPQDDLYEDALDDEEDDDEEVEEDEFKEDFTRRISRQVNPLLQVWMFPDGNEPSQPEGPGALPGATLNPDAFKTYLLERRILAKFKRDLRRGRSGPALGWLARRRHMKVVSAFVEFLLYSRRIPPHAVNELDLRLYLYATYPLQKQSTAVKHAVLESVGRFFAFMERVEGVQCPWAPELFGDLRAFYARVRTAPRGASLAAQRLWQEELVYDLTARNLLAVHEPKEGTKHVDPGPVQRKLYHDLQRTWLMWRDELVQRGVTKNEHVLLALIERQQLWMRTPHPLAGGDTPQSAIEREQDGANTARWWKRLWPRRGDREPRRGLRTTS